MGDRRQYTDGPSVIEHPKPEPGLRAAGLKQTTITHFETFTEFLSGDLVLGFDEQLVEEFWIGPGSWKITAEGTLTGAGKVGAQAHLTLRVEGSTAFPKENDIGQDVSPGATETIGCWLRPQSDDGMYLTLSARASTGPCTLSKVKIEGSL
jgi:hypothetical protein